MTRTRFALPVIITILVAGLLLTTSNTGFSKPVQAAANLQQTFNIPTQMVPNNWPMIPAGLGEGDSFRLLFVSNGETTGISNAVSEYNTIVQTDALKNTEFKEDMARVFRALVSVYQGIDARGNTLTRKPEVGGDPGHDSPIYWVKGKKVADGYADFYDGSWDSGELRDSKGAAIATTAYVGGFVWTGSKSDGTPATTDTGWSVALGSPPAWWSFGMRYGAYGRATASGSEIYLGWGEMKHSKFSVYGISPLIKVRSTTGPKPVISGPTGTVTGPFDMTITFPDDHQINYMELGDVQVSGGKASNLRGRNWTDAGKYGVTFTVTITPDYATSIDAPTTVSVSMGAGAVHDNNGWESVASDTFTVKSVHLARVATTIPFDSDGVGTVPQNWALIPSTSLKPGDSFRLLFITSDTRRAESTNIDDYNSFVQTAAGRNTLLSSFSSRFRVLGSTSGAYAIDNTGTRGAGVPIYWLEGEKAADNYFDFYDGSWDSRVGVDEQGKQLPRVRDATREVYKTLLLTGTNNDGTGNSQALGSAQFLATSLDRDRPFHAFTTVNTGRAIGHLYALSPVLKIAKPGGL